MAILRLNPVRLDNFRGDLFGGLTAAIVALPLALAFGVASGAGPLAGLYGAVFVGLFASLFGGTPSQISGPTGPMTIVAASVFTQYASQPGVAFTVVMMAGGFQLLFGYLKLGRYVNLMPYPVISGFMTGIGCILVIMQLNPLLGFNAPQTVVNALSVLPGYLADADMSAVAVGLTALAVCVLTPRRLARVVPAHLLGLVAATALALALPGVAVLGPMPSGMPDLQMPSFNFAQLNHMLLSAAVLAALGSIDSLLTSLVADNVTRTYHDSDKELLGQGLGNIAAGLFGGIPGAGATIRTLSNVHAGGRTALSGIVHAVALAVLVIGLGDLVAYIPYAALAGILIKVGIDVIDWRFIRRMHRAPRVDQVLLIVVLFLTIFVDIITAVGTGVVLASLVFVKDMAEHQVESIKAISDPDHDRLFTPEDAAVCRRCREHALYLHLSGLISFGAANEMTRKFGKVGSYQVLAIDLLDVPRVDGSAALALEELIQRAVDSDKTVFLVGLSGPVMNLMRRLGSLDLIAETRLLDSRSAAVQAIKAELERQGLPLLPER